ncbi:phage portal protein [Roseomonas sp. KE0001]|uniref:phage portal protein n=1 Tax=Roseomonas sp. KE0001 TaxID=2479201 RepID=UPI0018DFB3E5|nr:phage portal protein [Roseomonas sp. KE0001]MBI0432977.1 phage portal protein [Roseomonas sp. KE0001]
MGILSRFFGKAETRALDWGSFGQYFGVAPTHGPGAVSPILAENLATVTACVSAVSSVMASLPAYVYRRKPNGRTELYDHPVARLVRNPSDGRLTWPDFVEWLVAQVLLYGNGMAEIAYDGAGRPTALLPVPWLSVAVVVLPSGRIAYDVLTDRGPTRRLLEGEVLHVRDRSDDGIVGRSRISRAPDVLRNAASLQEWSGAVWQNQATPSGVLSAPGAISPDTAARLKAQAQINWAGAHNAKKIMVLGDGLAWTPCSVSPEDAEVLASRRFTVEELCRLFQVPPPIVQDLSHGTFTNSREAGRWFAQFSLAPLARKIEAEFERSVFGASSADCLIELDMSGLMRADAEARWQSHKIAVDAGILDPDEIREIEGWNPRPTKPKPDNDGPVVA